MFRRSAVLILLLVTGCAAVHPVPAPVAPMPPPAVPASDEIVALRRGEVVPDDGVWMSTALAAEKAGNCKKWEKVGSECLDRLSAEPSAISKAGYIAIAVVSALACGTAGFLAGRASK